MLSVIIINSEIYEQYQRYAYFFNWFEDNSNVVVCQWNKGAADKTNIDETVPMLFDTIKNAPEWNAYVIDEPFFSAEYMSDDFDRKTQYSVNPYDRDHGRSDEYYESEDSLLQLVYILGGRGVEKLEHLTNYKFRAARPGFIFLLTPRIFEGLDMQKMFLCKEVERMLEAEDKKNELGVRMKSYEYSEFWERYEYSPSCRFFVFDFPDCENVAYENSWFLFWLSIYTLLLNSFGTSEIEPYKLHKLSIDISNERFETFLNKYYSALSDARDASANDIENELKTINASRQDTSSSGPFDMTPVFVNFPHVELENFYPETGEFGMFKDRPELDTEVWKQFREQSFTETVKLFKGTRRGKNEAIDAMNQTLAVDIPLLKNRHISKYDAEDISDQLNDDEMKMLLLETDNKATRAVFEKKVDEASEKVEKAMKGRVYKKTFLRIVLVSALVAFLGYIPFVMSAVSQNVASLLVALIVAAASAAGVMIAGVIGLKRQRKKFGDVLEEYNDSVYEAMSDVREGARTQGDYLTMLQDYMEKYQMLKSGRVDEKHMKHLEYLSRVQGNYEDALERCSSLAGLCHIKLKRTNSTDSDNTVLFLPDRKIYLHEDTYGIKLQFNNVPDRLDAPFAFIDRLGVDEELLYEVGQNKTYDHEDDAAEGVEE